MAYRLLAVFHFVVKYVGWSISNENHCIRLKFLSQFIYQLKIHFL